MSTRLLFDKARLHVTLQRLARQVLEHHPKLENLCVIGIQPRGARLSRRFIALLKALRPEAKLYYGELDITFHRDDFRCGDSPLLPEATDITFDLEGRDVVLVDDVLFTGRTVRAAMDAMLSYGRPKSVELLVLIDRQRMRELPVEPFYRGIAVDTLDHEKVLVEWEETHGADSVYIQQRTPTPNA